MGYISICINCIIKKIHRILGTCREFLLKQGYTFFFHQIPADLISSFDESVCANFLSSRGMPSSRNHLCLTISWVSLLSCYTLYILHLFNAGYLLKNCFFIRKNLDGLNPDGLVFTLTVSSIIGPFAVHVRSHGKFYIIKPNRRHFLRVHSLQSYLWDLFYLQYITFFYFDPV